MSRFSRTFALIAVAAVVMTTAGSSLCQAGKPAPTPDWEYVPEAGGWLDWNTGLVWGENTYYYFDAIMPDTYFNGSWNYINTVVLPAYRDSTGFSDWRFPTNAELQQAAAENFTDYAFPDGLSNPWVSEVVTWTSNGGGHYKTYFGSLATGELRQTIADRSYLNLTPVRRVFWP